MLVYINAMLVMVIVFLVARLVVQYKAMGVSDNMRNKKARTIELVSKSKAA